LSRPFPFFFCSGSNGLRANDDDPKISGADGCFDFLPDFVFGSESKGLRANDEDPNTSGNEGGSNADDD
jgi:hypothetical protein